MPTTRTVMNSVVVIATVVVASQASHGQEGSPNATESATQASSAEDAARREVLESKEWVTMRNDFQKWLRIQKAYSADEVTAIVNQLNDRALRLSADELRELLSEMQDRLEVLLSPEAADARKWASQYLADPRASETRADRPDVMTMSADEIRSELQGIQRRQSAQQQSQADFDRIRAMQAEAAMGVHAARRQTQQQITDSRSRAAINAQARSPYAPRAQDLPNFTDFDSVSRDLNRRPYHAVTPWGTPLRWNPLRDDEWYEFWW
ncbi:hypothetical protein [Aeoliella sp.]|uniref:hypothetical protein n=1 Tax=Aeoliella sp. TaxID=2795800 RepID=UPI003CCC3526